MSPAEYSRDDYSAVTISHSSTRCGMMPGAPLRHEAFRQLVTKCPPFLLRDRLRPLPAERVRPAVKAAPFCHPCVFGTGSRVPARSATLTVLAHSNGAADPRAFLVSSALLTARVHHAALERDCRHENSPRPRAPWQGSNIRAAMEHRNHVVGEIEVCRRVAGIP